MWELALLSRWSQKAGARHVTKGAQGLCSWAGRLSVGVKFGVSSAQRGDVFAHKRAVRDGVGMGAALQAHFGQLIM